MAKGGKRQPKSGSPSKREFRRSGSPKGQLVVSGRAVKVHRTGDGSTTLEVDHTLLPTPTRAMTATRAEAWLRDDSVELVFAQVVPITSKKERVSAALVIHVALEHARRILFEEDGQEKPFRGQLLEYCAHEGYEAEPVSWDFELPERTVHERATVLSMAYVGPEAEIRAYVISVNDFRRLQQGARLDDADSMFRPIVEVRLSTVTLARLVNTLYGIVGPREAQA